MKTYLGSIGLLLFALFSVVAGAQTTREVKHSPGAGQFATVQAAYDVSASGDTVLIIDNSAPFVETVNINRTGITVKGDPSLDPRPTVTAASPGLWHAIVGTGTNNTVENLILVGGDWSCVDANAGGLMTLRNCKISKGAATAVYAEGPTLNLIDCLLTEGPCGLKIIGAGTVTLTGCTVTGNATREIIIASTASATLNLNSTLIMAAPGAGDAPWHRLIDHDPGLTYHLNVDNCTLASGGASVTDIGIIARDGDSLSFMNSIFYNMSTTLNVGGTPAALIENYNAYQKVLNTTGSYGTAGAQSLNLADTDPLFKDAAAGDYRVYSSSPVAKLNSTGTPAYAGSAGVYQCVNQWKNVNVPNVHVSAPVIDGTINDSEWADAVPIVMNHANMLASFGFAGAATNATDADFSGTYYFLWDAQYLYGAAKVNDAQVVYLQDQAHASGLNGTDAAQFILANESAMTGAAGGAGQYIFDFAPGFSDATSTAGFFQHWNSVSAPNTLVKSRLVTGGYEVEFAIKWSDLTSMPITPAIGTKLGFVTLLINKSTPAADDFWFTADAATIWSDASTWNKFTLTGAVPVELSNFSVE